MFVNYCKISIRNLFKQKIYSFINIGGLALGIAVSIIIGVYILTEVNYDTFHENSKRIYRVGTFLKFGENGVKIASSNFPIGNELKSLYPEVENSTRLRRFSYTTQVKFNEQEYAENDVFYADQSIFDIFSFNMILGNPKTALDKPYSIVITKDIAKKYFGDKLPLGEVLKLEEDRLYTVTGIVDNVPANSHINFNMLCSFESIRDIVGSQMDRWMGDFQNYTYILLRDNFDYKELEVKFPSLIENNVGELLKTINGTFELFLQPLRTIHLHSSHLENVLSGIGDIKQIYIFSVVVFFILLIACVNFINLTTARSSIRYREVGVKKVFGARRSQLIFQFLFESLFFTFLSTIIALFIIEYFWPIVNDYTGLDISVFYGNISWFILSLILLIIVIGFTAGIYPAFHLSSFNPSSIVKGVKTDNSKLNYRRILVILQFVISITLIGSTYIIQNQINYLHNKKLGFSEDNIIAVPIDNNTPNRSNALLKNDLLSYSEINEVALCSNIPGHGSRHNVFLPDGFEVNEAPLISAINIDKNFLSTLDIELVEGRNFSDQHTTDPSNSIIINEAAVKKFGWENPIGKEITELNDTEPTKTVIGVIKDYHFNSLYNKITPLILENEKNRNNYFLINITSNNIDNTINFIRNVLENPNSSIPFEFFFLDEVSNNLYHKELRFSRIFTYFTSIAIFLACLGLLGLTAYTAEQRTKEVGIRKVLGASITSISVMLSKEFFNCILFANLIAWPIIYIFMNKWLQNFAYKIQISWWMFLVAGVFSISIAIITVSFQVLRAAIANPIDSIRYE